MTKEEKWNLLSVSLCGYLPYGLRGTVTATGIDSRATDMDGFYQETYFDVDVELDRVDVSNDEIFVSALGDNTDLCDYIYECQDDGSLWSIEDFKPYLRQLSSMTEEEKQELKELVEEDLSEFGQFIKDGHGLSLDGLYMFDKLRQLDWLNSHHFDYRGLIGLGVASEAKGIYDIVEDAEYEEIDQEEPKMELI